MKDRFTIGKLARMVGGNIQTVRYYGRRGLLLPMGRKKSGYRLYDERSLKRLGFIRFARGLDFSLDEIKGLMELRDEPSTACDMVRKKTRKKIEAIKKKIKDLESITEILKEMIDACKRRLPREECPIFKTIEKGVKGRGKR